MKKRKENKHFAFREQSEVDHYISTKLLFSSELLYIFYKINLILFLVYMLKYKKNLSL